MKTMRLAACQGTFATVCGAAMRCIPLFVFFFCGAANAGQIDQRELYAREKEAAEAADSLAGVLISVSGKSTDCRACRAEFKRIADAVAEAQHKNRSEIAAALADDSVGHVQARARRLAAAEQAAADYAGLQKRVAAKSLCGSCAGGGGNSRAADLEKEFGKRQAEAILASLNDALGSLRRAAHSMRRRWYDDGFGKRFDALFETWMGKPTIANMQLAADCLDGLFASLVVKNVDPAAHIKAPLKSGIQEIRDAATSGGVSAFVYFGITEAENHIFLGPGFFTYGLRGGTLIHEEAHLLYDATDKGNAQLRSGGYRPPTHKGRGAILDAYSIEAFVEQLAKF